MVINKDISRKKPLPKQARGHLFLTSAKRGRAWSSSHLHREIWSEGSRIRPGVNGRIEMWCIYMYITVISVEPVCEIGMSDGQQTVCTALDHHY